MSLLPQSVEKPKGISHAAERSRGIREMSRALFWSRDMRHQVRSVELGLGPERPARAKNGAAMLARRQEAFLYHGPLLHCNNQTPN